MALNPVTELEAIVDALSAANIPYALCGGLALGLHGHPRATQDVDLLIESQTMNDVLVCVKPLGFDIPSRREAQRVSKLDPETQALLALDLLTVNEELRPVWESRITVDAGARKLTLVSRDGLVTMKRISGRLQDLADIARLEGTADDEQG